MDVKALTDYELIKNCLAGDTSFFTELVSRYKNLVYSIILRMTNDGEEANDLAQEVFFKAYRGLSSYSPEFKFSTWIMRITTNHIIDYRRKKRAETNPIEDYEQTLYAPTHYSPEVSLVKNEQLKQLNEAVEHLPDMYKVPIVLYHQKGMSYQEISEATNEPLSKVKNRIFRGRKLLKEALTNMWEGESYVL